MDRWPSVHLATAGVTRHRLVWRLPLASTCLRGRSALWRELVLGAACGRISSAYRCVHVALLVPHRKTRIATKAEDQAGDERICTADWPRRRAAARHPHRVANPAVSGFRA